MAVVNGKGGTFNIKSKNDSISGYVHWQETYNTDTYLSTNKTTVTITAYLHRTNSWDGNTWFDGYTCTRTAYFGTEKVSGTTTYLNIAPGGGYTLVYSASKEITHDNTGDKSIVLGFESSLTQGSEAVRNAYTVPKTTTTVTLTTIYSNGSAPTRPTIDTSAGNNTVTLSGTRGKDGTKNAIDGNQHELNYSFYNSSGGVVGSDTFLLGVGDGNTYNYTIHIPSEATAINAKAWCKFSRQATNSDSGYYAQPQPVTYYHIPNKPGKPVLDMSKLSRNRLTIKEPWTFTWAAPSNNVKGYHVRLKKNGDNYLYIQRDGDTIKAGGYGEVDVTSNTIKVNPVGLFVPGDTVSISVEAFNTNGKDETDWHASGYTTPAAPETSIYHNLISGYIDSSDYEVKNAGIVRVKVDGTWKEGQVYIKANGTWHEAETVYTKVNDGWLESQ